MTAIEIDEAVRDFMRMDALNSVYRIDTSIPNHYELSGHLVINNSADAMSYKLTRAALLSCFELIIERLEAIGADWLEVPELKFSGQMFSHHGKRVMLLEAEALFVFIQDKKK